MAKSLPPRPNLEQLRNQAKDLIKSHRSGDPQAWQRVQQNHPRWSNTSASDLRSATLSLTDAQLVVAREYGFASWAKLKTHVQALDTENADPIAVLRQAFADDNPGLFRSVLARHPALKARINEPVAAFDAPLVTCARSREMLDVLLEAGADINAKSRWWAGGFGLLHSADPIVAEYAIQRGAVVDAHAAARLGLMDKLRELIAADPALVHARGGDGQTPLHFASTVEIAAYLLEHGADINARDIDHESTPPQWMIRDRQPIARFLVERGCQTDILIAAALGDAGLVQRHLEADPNSIRIRVTHEYFPKRNPKSGGPIYQWTLGWFVSPHDVAKQFGHEEIFRLLMEQSPADVKLLAVCWAGDNSAMQSLLRERPDIVSTLSDAYRRQVADAARNNNLAAVRTMLAAGFPVEALGQHGGTALHWAAFHGNAEMTQEILGYNPPLELADHDFHSKPLGWAIHGSENGWYCRTGNYAGTVEALLAVGAKLPEKIGGTEAVREVLRRHGAKD